jgi:hypothetical protein
MVDTSAPAIAITSVPALGYNGRASGTVVGVDFAEYSVAVYILVYGGWWIKPYANQPRTTLNADGTWSASITTGGYDQLATRIVAYLVPKNFSIPILLGASALPASLADFPFASVSR